MKYRFSTLMLLAALGLAGQASAADFTVGDLTVSNVWSRATAGGAKNGVVYLTIANKGGEADRLVKVASPVAKKAELHITRMEGGVMKMEPVEAIEVEPGTSTTLKPGGLHIMLMGLAAPLQEGRMFPLTLTFEKAGSLEVTSMIGKVGAMEGHMMKQD